MDYAFEPLTDKHRSGVMAIFNHYILNSTAAYREQPVGDDHFLNFLEVAKTFPAYAIVDGDGAVIGFCMIKQHSPVPTFAETAELMYFLDQRSVGKGIGSAALERLEADARGRGIRTLLASISSENEASLGFHRKKGFAECGRFPNIIKKFGRRFSIVWMSKELA